MQLSHTSVQKKKKKISFYQQALGDGEGQGSLICCTPQRVGHD